MYIYNKVLWEVQSFNLLLFNLMLILNINVNLSMFLQIKRIYQGENQ